MFNPRQSSRYDYYGCKNKACVASMAIDGNNETRSITAANDNNSWWMAELDNTVRIVNISIIIGIYYFNQGRYNTFKVETGVYTLFCSIRGLSSHIPHEGV